MKRVVLLVVMCFFMLGFSQEESFNIEVFKDYQKEFESEEIGICSKSKTKTYMDYRAITDPSSKQYKYIREHMEVDEVTGFLYDEDGFVGVALGSYYGVIGDRYYVTLESGVVLPLVKIEEKADNDTDGGCFHFGDGSVIEFVIDKDYAAKYFKVYGNGLILSGNYNNYELFKGEIIKVEKVSNQRNQEYVTYLEKELFEFSNLEIFDYASGY